MERPAMAELDKLRKLADWYREFAERAGNPWIWEARLKRAAELERESAQLEERLTRIGDHRACPRISCKRRLDMPLEPKWRPRRVLWEQSRLSARGQCAHPRATSSRRRRELTASAARSCAKPNLCNAFESRQFTRELILSSSDAEATTPRSPPPETPVFPRPRFLFDLTDTLRFSSYHRHRQLGGFAALARTSRVISREG